MMLRQRDREISPTPATGIILPSSLARHAENIKQGQPTFAQKDEPRGWQLSSSRGCKGAGVRGVSVDKAINVTELRVRRGSTRARRVRCLAGWLCQRRLVADAWLSSSRLTASSSLYTETNGR